MVFLFGGMTIFGIIFLGVIANAWRTGKVTIKGWGGIDRHDEPILFHMVMVWLTVVGSLVTAMAVFALYQNWPRQM